MDVNAPVHVNSRKFSEEWNMDKSRNRIGNLPDGILEHILSLLPTKDAVKTSVLSKKWQYLWMSVPSFDFEQGQLEKRALFMKFVERALMVHTSNLEKFTLSCDILADALRINAWILGVVRHKVQELHLSLHNTVQPFVLPHCLFSCESITVLELCMGLYIQVPSFICFSSLKKLTLRNVIFPEEKSTQQLFSGCPVLEELDLIDCDWENAKGVSISAPKLTRLGIIDSDDDQDNSNACQVIIFGTNLKSLSYIGDLLNDFCFYDSTSLVDASIKVDKRDREVSYRAHKLLQGLSSVKDLSTTVDTVEILNNVEELLPLLPVFYNLTHLEFDDDTMDFACGALLSILQNSPCLSSLKFREGVRLSEYHEKEDWILDPVPPCFLTHLKTIEIWDFSGTRGECYVVKILLQNAVVLERMILTCSAEFSGSLRKKEIYEDLLMLPKGSIGCMINFS